MRDMHGLGNAGRARCMKYNERLILNLLERPLKRVRVGDFGGAVVEEEVQIGHENLPHRLPLSQYLRKYGKRLFWLKNDLASNFLQDGEVSLEIVPMGAEKGLHHTNTHTVS